MIIRMIFAGLFSAALGACVMTPDPQDAVLANTEADNMAALESALSAALGRANIKLGAGDLTAGSTVTVLPPPRGPLEMNSPAMPVHFTLMTDGNNCWLYRTDTDERFDAPGLACNALPSTE